MVAHPCKGALEKLILEDSSEFEASLDSISNSRTAWATDQA